LALANQHRSRTPELISALVQRPPADPVKAFTQFYAIMTRESLRYLDKVLWRHVHAAATISGWDEYGSKRWRHEGDLIDFQCMMIASLQRLGALTDALPARPLAEVIHATAYFWWERFIAEDPMTRSEFMANLGQDLAFLLNQSAARNCDQTPPIGAASKRGRSLELARAAGATSADEPDPSSNSA
jgi:hypothetical protein